MAIDEPQYKVVRAYEVFEVRRYEPYLVAETVVNAAADDAGNQGFRILAGYIFGQNKGARRIEMTAPVAQAPTRIAMTAPVAQSPGSGGYVVQFAMPQNGRWKPCRNRSIRESLCARCPLERLPSSATRERGHRAAMRRI